MDYPYDRFYLVRESEIRWQNFYTEIKNRLMEFNKRFICLQKLQVVAILLQKCSSFHVSVTHVWSSDKYGSLMRVQYLFVFSYVSGSYIRRTRAQRTFMSRTVEAKFSVLK